MNDLLSLTILTALFAAGLLFCFTKWGWLGWYQAYRKKWMPEGDCYFCLSFWVAVPAYALVFAYVALTHLIGWYALLLIPILVGCNLASATLSAFVCTVIIGTSESN